MAVAVPNAPVPSVEQDALPGRAIPRFSNDTSPMDFGAGLGAGLESAGNDFGRMDANKRATLAAAQARANADVDRVRSAQYMQKVNSAMVSTLYGGDALDPKAPYDPNAVFRQSGDALAGLPEKATQDFSDQVDKIMAGAPPHIQAMTADFIAEKIDRVNTEAHRYQFEQFNSQRIETFKNTVSQENAIAGLDWRDPANYGHHKDVILAAGQSLAAVGGKASIKAYSDGGYRQDLDQLNESVIGGHLAAGDIAGAQRALDAHANDLSSGVVHEKLQSLIQGAADRIENKQKDAARDAYEDALKGSQGGVPGADRLVTDAQLKLLHPTTWQREREYLSNSADTGATEKKYDTMTPAAIQEDLDARRTTTAQSGLANDLELDRMRQQAADRSVKRRTVDGQQFLLTTSDRPPLDLSKPIGQQTQVLNSRFNTLQDDAQRIGAPVQPLTRRESASIGAALDSMPADKKLAVMDQYRDALGDDRFRQLMLQVRPNSPATAKAALLLPRDSWDAPSWYSAKNDDPTQAIATAKTIMQGQDILNPGHLLTKEQGKDGFKGGMEMPKAEKFLQAWNSNAAVSNGIFAGRPQEADTALEAAKSYYAAKVAMSTGSGTSEELNDAAWQEAMRAVVGNTDDHFVHTVPVPRGMDPSQFPTVVRAQLAALEDKYQLRPGTLKGYGLQEIGHYGSGRYGLVNGDKHAAAPDGNWLQFDLNKVGRDGR